MRFFATGGALGFDMMAALVILKLREEIPHIRLILVLPCREQSKRWSEKDIKTYNLILEKADKVVYVSENYHTGCMHERNRHMANHSGFCICYLSKVVGGTAYTVNYARQKGVQIINCYSKQNPVSQP